MWVQPAGETWDDAVLYELHIGAFTPEGTFSSAIARLDHLARLGVTALQIMPVAAFSGARNWGYDGVYTYAPDASYGRPETFQTLVRETTPESRSPIVRPSPDLRSQAA